MVLAAKFDPWFRKAVRASDLVVATDSDAAVALPIARQFDPHIDTSDPADAERSLTRLLGQTRLTAALILEVSNRGETVPPDENAVNFTCEVLRGIATDLPRNVDLQPVYDYLECLVRTGNFSASLAVVAAAENIPSVSDDPVIVGYRTVSELSTTAHTEQNVRSVASRVLERADHELETRGTARAAVLAALAMDVLFHRELHRDVLRSALIDEPETFLAPLRSSRVGKLLTSPTHAIPAGDTAPRAPRLRVKMVHGLTATFSKPVTRVLEQAPATDVEVIDLGAEAATFRNVRMDPQLVQMRLDHSLGHKPRRHRRSREKFDEADVVLADWAYKHACLASMSMPTGTRLVVRAHSVDFLHPWFHLIDWRRVDALICVSPAMATLAHDLLGERIANTPIYVVPNVVDTSRFSLDKTDDAPRTLCMIGWGRRVKDPLWAVEILARLAAQDPRWRLMLVGNDFVNNPIASERDYAQVFRQRASAEDVRDKIIYTGFKENIPEALRQAGFILSTSRRESQHLAVVEGALSGAIPVVRNWPLFARRQVAAAIYPASWIVEDIQEAADRIQAYANLQQWRSASTRVRTEMLARTDVDSTTNAYQHIVLGDLTLNTASKQILNQSHVGCPGSN